MNEWVKRSIDLANSSKYLDRVSFIYPVESSLLSREIPKKIEVGIKESFVGIDKLRLMQALLKLKKFPIDNPYIPTLRRYPELLDKNQEVAKKLGDQIISIAVNGILDLARQPKKISRQYGSVFQNWLQRNIKYPFLEERDFKKYNKVAFLQGSEKVLKQFVLTHFDLKYPVDFIFKIKDKFYMGQAKFITDFGGQQRKQFYEAISMAKIKKRNIIGIAILDGILWFKSKNEIALQIRKFNGIALSALLLKEFIRKQIYV